MKSTTSAMIYYSYGSNMSFKRLKARISNITRLGVAVLYGHELRFHKVSLNDGSGKCDIFETNDPQHRVLGVVYEIDPRNKLTLDRYEGVGHGYEIKWVAIEMEGEQLTAFTYYATHTDQGLRPLHWYKEHVLIGARENKLPEQYINKIELVESIDDHDTERHARELEIYL